MFSRCYLYSLSLFGIFFFFMFLSFSFFQPLIFYLPSPFYSFNPYSYQYNCPVACQSLRDIFFNFIGFLPSLILELLLLVVVFTVQAVSLVFNTAEVGKNPIIDVEVKIFYLLACSRNFLWFRESPGNHTWIIRALYLG